MAGVSETTRQNKPFVLITNSFIIMNCLHGIKKKKPDKLDLIKIEAFPFQVNVKRMQGQATDLEKTCEENIGGAGEMV